MAKKIENPAAPVSHQAIAAFTAAAVGSASEAVLLAVTSGAVYVVARVQGWGTDGSKPNRVSVKEARAELADVFMVQRKRSQAQHWATLAARLSIRLGKDAKNVLAAARAETDAAQAVALVMADLKPRLPQAGLDGLELWLDGSADKPERAEPDYAARVVKALEQHGDGFTLEQLNAIASAVSALISAAAIREAQATAVAA